MMNPSTADASQDDATVRSCVRLAKGLGFGGITVCNLFAWRSTNPKELPQDVADAIGIENDAWLEMMAIQADTIVAAWGALAGEKGPRHDRILRVTELLTRHHPINAFTMTKHGFPSHPLYLKTGTTLATWKPKLTICDITARKISRQLEEMVFGP
jgi:hypothetical protein